MYWPLTAVLAVVFLATLFVVQQVFKAVIGEPSELAVAAAAFVNIFLFQPLRRQIQTFIFQHFFVQETQTVAAAPSPVQVTDAS